jgi:Family of unknown function (DUF6922)
LKATVNISKTFPKHLFWDMDYSKLSIKKDKETIIPRALFATTKDTFKKDITNLEELYSKEEIINALQNTKERISNTLCSLVSKRYKITPFYRYKL